VREGGDVFIREQSREGLASLRREDSSERVKFMLAAQLGAVTVLLSKAVHHQISLVRHQQQSKA
jgi:hypothetical protein